MNEQRSKKRITKLLAMLLAFFMVLAFALPNNPEISFADSNDADETSLFSLLNDGKMNDGEPSGVTDEEKANDGEALFGEGLTRTQILEEGGVKQNSAPNALSAPNLTQQAAGTYITVKDQYGNPVDNVYFTIYNTYDQITYYGKAVQGVLYLYSSNEKYENLSLETFGFNENRYHEIKVIDNSGDTANYTLDSSVVFAKFYIQNGRVIRDSGSFAITLQSKAQPPAPAGITMTAKDTNGKPAPGIAFLLYKEGEPNIQANLISDSNGALAHTANSEVFDPKILAAGTYTVKVTPQSSSDTAKATYVMDATKIYATFTVTDDGAGKKMVTFTPASRQNLVFPLIADLPKGEATLTVNKKNEKGDPLSGVTFQLQGPVDSAAAGTRTSGPTGVDGKTTFENLAYGEYLLTELSAPDGYVVSKQVIHVMLGKDADTPIVGGTDVTRGLLLKPVTWNPPHVENGVNTIYPNQAESLSVDAVIQVPAATHLAPGDFFTIQLSDNVDTYGLVQSKEQGLDIFADGGKLAEGKFDPTTRTITYTFTNLVKTFTANQIKLHTVLFIDKVKVPQEAKSPSTITLSYGLGQTTPSTSSFQVLYRPYYYPQQTVGSNIGTMYSIYNPDKKTATTYIYVNPLTNQLKKGKLEISGKGSVLINALTDVKVYDGGSGSTDTMVPSWGVVPTKLTEVNDLSPVIDGNANKVTIDFGDRLDTGSQAYIVKVTTGYDPSSTEDLGMVAKLYGYFNGYWSQYYNYSYYDYDWAAAQTYMKFYEHEGTATGVGFDAKVTVSNPKNSIEWTKVNESGMPLEGAEFRLVRVQNGSEQTVIDKLVSNRDGRLSASGLAPGSYKLYETKAPEGYEIPKDDTGKDKPLATFTVNEKGEIQNPDPEDGKIVNGRREGRFSVHKTDNAENEANRKPLKDTEFTLTPLKEDPAHPGSWIVDDAKHPITKTTDADGNLTFSGLAIGKYQLKETKPSPGYVLRDTTWTVEVKEEVVDEAHPEIKRVVTTVTEDASPSLARSAAFDPASVSFGRELIPTSTKDTYLAPLLDHTMQRLQKAQALLSSDAKEEASSFADGMLYSADAPLRSAGAPLRSLGAGKYQYYNPVVVNATKWPANVQEMDVDGDGAADYKITQTMEPDGTTPGQYKVKVKVEKMPETLELVVLMDNCAAFSQLTGRKTDRFQWAGMTSGTLQDYPTVEDWLDYYFRGVRNSSNPAIREGRITSLLKTIQQSYPNARVTLLGAGGAPATVQYWTTNPYTSLPIADAINRNQALKASGVYNPNVAPPKWEFTGGWGRAGLKDAMQQAYNTLNSSTAQKKAFFHLQGVPTFGINEFTAPLLPFWDDGTANDARRTFAKIQNIARVSWLVELDPSAYDQYFFRPSEYLANGLPDPSQVHILQNASRYWPDKDQYWNQVDAAAMESAYNQAMPAIAQEITNSASSAATLNLQIQLADNVLWRTAPSGDASMTTAGVRYDPATGSLTKSNFTMTSDKPLEFSYYIKANSQASGARLNVFENINQAKTSGLQVNTTKPDGTVESTTSAIPIPQLRIPGWETTVKKYWYGNSDADNARFQTFPETGATTPTVPTSSLDIAKRKASQVLIYSNTVYSDDPETKIGLGQKLKSPYASLRFARALPYYDNNGMPIHYQATEYHDPIFHTKMNLVKNDATLKQTFYIGAQMDPVVVKTDIQVTKQWGSGTKPEDQVPVTAKLLAFRKNAEGSETPLTDAELKDLLGAENPTSITLDANGKWTGAFTDLPTSQVVKGEATEIVYRVKEVPLPGFDVSYLYDFQEVKSDGTTKPTHYVTIVNQKHTLVSVTNAPNEVDFYKVDGSGKALAGARFTLQKETETPGKWADVAGYVDITTVKVTANGVERAKLHFEKLDPGNYRLNETTVPTGYKEPTNPVATFTVSETTGKVEKVKALNASGVLADGTSGVDIYNVSKDRPPVDFYLDKLGGVQGETLHRLTSGTLVMKLEKTGDASKSRTVTFDLSKDYGDISNTGKRGLKITIPADWPAGDYALTEVTAPAGYQKMAGTIRLRYTVPEDLSSTTGRTLGVVDAQGNVQSPYLFEEKQIDGVWTPTYAAGYAPLAIENYVFVLPTTAGPGTFFFTLAGAFLLGLAMSLRGVSSKPRPRRRG